MFGGRPMKMVTSCLFMDVVVNKPVNLYVDKRGRYWMCLDRWGLFGSRVPHPGLNPVPPNLNASS